MRPLLPGGPTNPPWHSRPYDALPPVYVQNASLEIAWSKVVFEQNSISGNEIIPFFTDIYEGLDINYSQDWRLVEDLVQSNPDLLPRVTHPAITPLQPGEVVRA